MKWQDLTQDQTSFLLGILRPDINPGLFQTFTLFIYASSDGLAWTERTRLGVNNPPLLSMSNGPVSIAARSDGSIVVAHNPVVQGPQVFRFDGSSWSLLTSTVFPTHPLAGTEVALIATGRP